MQRQFFHPPDLSHEHMPRWSSRAAMVCARAPSLEAYDGTLKPPMGALPQTLPRSQAGGAFYYPSPTLGERRHRSLAC